MLPPPLEGWAGRACLGFPGAPPTPPSECTSKWLWGGHGPWHLSPASPLRSNYFHMRPEL